jgi:hypothetical protein
LTELSPIIGQKEEEGQTIGKNGLQKLAGEHVIGQDQGPKPVHLKKARLANSEESVQHGGQRCVVSVEEEDESVSSDSDQESENQGGKLTGSTKSKPAIVDLKQLCIDNNIPTKRQADEKIRDYVYTPEKPATLPLTCYENDVMLGDDPFHVFKPLSSKDPVRRNPKRNSVTTGENAVKLLEHLAQTPEKERKKYTRVYRKDLESLANSIATGEVPDQLSKNIQSFSTKERQKYARNYREDLESIANNIISGKVVPNAYKDAMASEEWPKWKAAIDKEIAALYRTNALEKVRRLPQGVKGIRCRWVFKIKPANKQEPEIYKARLVAQGFSQKHGVDYQDTFAAVAKMTSLRILVALSAVTNSRMTKLDVSNAFLESELDREVYILPPEGFPQDCYFLLKKALYGLKQSPRLFKETFTKELKLLGFESLETDHCIFKHKTKDLRMLLVVDDCIIEGKDENYRSIVEKRLSERFKIKTFDKVEHFIGLQLEHTPEFIRVHQKDYILTLLERFNLKGCSTANTPAVYNQQGSEKFLPDNVEYRQIVGSLIYLIATRPDVCSAVTHLSRHLEKPTEKNMIAAKRVLRYLAGTAKKGVVYKKGQGTLKQITCFSDSDWAGDRKTRKSVSGFVVYFAGAPICWKSKTQPTVALSSCEAEYVALTVAAKEIMWLVQFFEEIGNKVEQPVFVFGDNTASIALAKDPVHHERTKHIDIKHHFLRDLVMGKKLRLVYVPTADNVADVLTKATSPKIFLKLTKLMVNLAQT